MPRCYFVIILTFLLSCNNFNDSKEIEGIVHQWNDAHRKGKVNELENVYDNVLVFYGKDKTRQYCIKQKQAGIGPGFRQSIHSEINITKYVSGLVKCSFTKTVINKKGLNDHESYLLLKKIEGEYKIIGESDLQTDTKLGYNLQLGKEGSPSNSNSMLAGLAFIGLAGGGFWYYKERRKSVSKSPVVKAFDEAMLSNMIDDKLRNKFSETPDSGLTPEQEKGQAFEHYVIELFPRSTFTLEEWRSDKMINGRYPETNKDPDIVFRLNTKNGEHYFAVECKWRSNFYQGKVEIAKDYQLRHYKDYQRKQGIPVFIVLGIGGTPDNPEDVFTIPINRAYQNQMSESQLKPFYRYKRGSFFYHVGGGRLE